MAYPRENTCDRCGTHIGWVIDERGEMLALVLCDECADAEERQDDDDEPQWDRDYRDPLDEGDRGQEALEDASDEAMERWAERYDELNGGPEDDDDR